MCISVWSSSMWGSRDHETLTVWDTTDQSQIFEHLRPPTWTCYHFHPSSKIRVCVCVCVCVCLCLCLCVAFSPKWSLDKTKQCITASKMWHFTCFTTYKYAYFILSVRIHKGCTILRKYQIAIFLGWYCDWDMHCDVRGDYNFYIIILIFNKTDFKMNTVWLLLGSLPNKDVFLSL